jgi:microcompartment protein CcmL/EutN
MEGKSPGNALGILEFSQVARGMWAADAMLKSGAVQLKVAQTICPGKYLVFVGGAVGGVLSALEAGKATAAEWIVDEALIANVHPDVFPALFAATEVVPGGALGIIETFSAAAAVQAADSAVKTAEVRLVEIRLARGLGGRSFVLISGEVSAVQVAVDQAAAVVGEKGLLVDAVVIPAPDPDLWEIVL